MIYYAVGQLQLVKILCDLCQQKTWQILIWKLRKVTKNWKNVRKLCTFIGFFRYNTDYINEYTNWHGFVISLLTWNGWNVSNLSNTDSARKRCKSYDRYTMLRFIKLWALTLPSLKTLNQIFYIKNCIFKWRKSLWNKI